MSRSIWLSLFVLAILCTGSAFAICSGTLESDPNYWTQEKMDSAIPRDYILTDLSGKYEREWERAPQNSTAACAANYRKYTTTNTYSLEPFRSVGKIFFTMSGSNYVCSGSVGSSNTIWTAGHCVYDDSAKRWATNFIFVPAYYNRIEPHGRWTARSLCTTSQWQSGNIAYDYAVARFTTSFPNTLTPLALRYNLNPTDVSYVSYGYPAGSPFDGLWENTCTSGSCGRDTRTSPQTVSIMCDSTGGSSGGPWIQSDSSGYSIVSLNSYGYSNQPNRMYGPFFNGDTNTFWTQSQG